MTSTPNPSVPEKSAPATGWRRWSLLGPAFVAAVAYVDPGNVAANLTAGARHGYLLVWVLVVANLIAMVVQYHSAALGVVTGRSLASLVGDRLDRYRHGRRWRLLYATQAMVVAIATDIAEVVGGALALWLLFGTPLWAGGLIVGAVTLAALHWLRSRGEAVFQAVVTVVLLVLSLGFLAGLVWAPPDPRGVAQGLVPRFTNLDSVVLAAAMVGATVMPHAVYVHSTLAADRHRGGSSSPDLPRLLRLQGWDVALALVVAGSVNLSMVLVAAASLQGRGGTDTITGAHQLLQEALGQLPATVFAVALLLSGLGSAVVGTHAGARIFRDLRVHHSSPGWRRALTIAPAVALLTLTDAPTEVLVWSQLVLSFGIAFAVVPLVVLTSRREVMGEHRPSVALRTAGWVGVALVVALNLTLLGVTAWG